ncbi:hypothetical protein [Macrococcus animalis]|uniref:hypothetical protein n=1 Tax=Macrococcus animalis TaxID=3395467 RepID=UPI0039BE2E81
MEKHVKLYLGIATILILMSILPLLDAYQLHNNKQIAAKERLLSTIEINKNNITEVSAEENINVDMITVEHIFQDHKNKETVAHNVSQYDKLMKESKYYIRTYQLSDQLIQLKEDIKAKKVNELIINKKKINTNIKTNRSLYHHYVDSPIIYEKKIATGETLIMLMHQTKRDIHYIGMASHSDNIIGKITLKQIDLDGIWNNRINIVGFDILSEQHLSHYFFNVFIFYPLLTLILGVFLCYICYLRVKMTREERMRN